MFKEEKGVAEIDLRRGRRAIIDKEDYTLVSQYKWYLIKKEAGNVYVKSKVKGKIIGIHRFIMNVSDPLLVVDHIDGDPLNNRKSNLRVCTQGENARNQKLKKTNKSGYKGVTLSPSGKRWKAALNHKGKKIFGGSFRTITEAAQRYNELAIEYFGPFACLNKIPTDNERK